MTRRQQGRAVRRRAFDGIDTLVAPAFDVIDVIDEITWYMREHKVSRADLADAMCVSPGRVSRILSGGERLTPRTLGTVLAALGARLEINLHPVNEPAPV